MSQISSQRGGSQQLAASQCMSSVRQACDKVTPNDSVSQAGRHSTVSSTTSSAVARRMNNAATRAKLEAELALDAEMYQLELEELQLQRRKKVLGLKTQLAIVNAEDAVLAEAELPDGSVELLRPEVYVPVVEEEGSCNTDPEISFKNTRKWLSTAGPPLSVSDNSAILQMIADGQRQHKELIDAIRLPSTLLVSYDGDPLRYWNFVRSFDSSIDLTSVDDSSKLTRLIQFCTGKARKVIECCAIMEPSIGYKRARELLKGRFGDDFMIAEAWVRKITDHRVIRPYDNEQLQEFADELCCCIETLKAMGYVEELNGQTTLLKIIERLPNYVQLRFKREVRNIREKKNRSPNIEDIVELVVEAAAEANDPVYGRLVTRDDKPKSFQQQCNARTRNATSAAISSDANSVIHGRRNWNQQTSAAPTATTRQQQPCVLCGGNHTLFRCEQFKSSSVDDRINLVKQHRLCFNCLLPGHPSNRCHLNRTCSVAGCNRKHTKFLHPVTESSTGQQENPVQNSSIWSQNCCAVSNHIGAGNYKTVLPIVPVVVTCPDSTKIVRTFALLDSGSTNTFCSSELAQLFNIQGRQEMLSLTTLEKADSQMQTTVVALEVSDFTRSRLIELPVVYTKESLPIKMKNIATVEEIKQWPHLRDLELPDASCINSVTLLIGQDVPEALMPLEIRHGEAGSPYAVRTVLGWSLNGPIGRASRTRRQATANFIDFNLDQQVERLWKLDQVKHTVEMSVNDRQAVSIWQSSIQFDKGHYAVAIPFKRRPLCMPDNRYLADRRLGSLRSRLIKDRDVYEKYSSYMKELLDKGHAEEVYDDGVPGSVWYLPHHSVKNINKPEKVRIVFDCSAKYDGMSLNDTVLQGPDMTNGLVGVLLRFRQERIAFVADIESMFHQVKVTVADRDVLRFLWWPDGDLNRRPATYRMTVHLFGGVWSPSCCNFTLRRTAEDHCTEHSDNAVKTVFNSFYVDDCLKSVPSVEEAVQLVKEVSQLLHKGGFNLTKWVSNSSEVLSTIPTDIQKPPHQIAVTERALGVRWDIKTDRLGFSVVTKGRPLTRRGILSMISSIFDPLGLISPFLLPAKRILQELCRRKCDWDSLLPDDLIDSWQAWYIDQLKLEHVTARRCLKPDDFDVKSSYQLHHFSDASSYGYGTASYLRTVNADGRVSCCLAMARSRLAPIKSRTIPRLELSAATLAVDMDKLISKELELPLQRSVFWTDSTVVLHYINNVSKKFQTFVANRIAVIHDGSMPDQWRHVDTRSNPADDASRGLRVTDLIDNHRWFNGPSFLTKGECEWPINLVGQCELPDSDLEIKRDPVLYAVNASACEEDDIINRIFTRYSDWYRLKKTVAWLLRTKQALKVSTMMSARRMADPLSVADLLQSEFEIFKYIQRHAYPTEFKQLTDDNNFSSLKKSQIYRLEPFMSVNEVICVGGRLRSHPVILPQKHHVVNLLIRHFHEVSGHSGREHTLSLVRNRYWIVGARAVVRKVLAECMFCRRRNAKPVGQRMADLPDDRIVPSKPPFTNVGVDYFGPFMIKRGRSEVKRYGCLFTCLTVRAVHIEVVHSLETDSFIQALQRFISRRGQPELIRSDNGTNFVGAAKELHQAIGSWNQKKIDAFLRQQAVQWRFNPPAASHMGGVWERQIRTVRKVLGAVMKEQRVDDEGLSTLMCLVESIINSRPLTTVSDDHKDLEPLTPNHLLLLRSGVTTPLDMFNKEDVYCRKRWRQVNYLADIFWRRWIREYLPTLQLRQKWVMPIRNFQVNDIVIMMDDNLPRNMWPLGRITETFPGPDGLVRSAKLVTRSTTLVRPVHKLCMLEPVNI